MITRRTLPNREDQLMALNFRLEEMGWFSFEELCRTILRVDLDQSVEAFSRGQDGGCDGIYTGPWVEDGTTGSGVLQCKHRSSPVARLALSDLKHELPKIKRLASDPAHHSYVLMTNARISANAASKIKEAIQDQGFERCRIYGYETLCELLRENSALRALVPRLYGLGDLGEILDQRRYEQAEAILAAMNEDLARLVPVQAHADAHTALANEGFALLVGRPGSGKTSIAGSLLLGAVDSLGTQPIKLNSIGEFEHHWNPSGRPQIFWIDDVFGSNQYDVHTAIAWNRATPSLVAAIRTGTRLICTTRDYIFAEADADLRTSAFPLLRSGTVVIKVEEMTQAEREQILYNHLKLGRQDAELLSRLKALDLERVAASEHFLPELARRLGDPLFTQHLRTRSIADVIDFFNRPTDYLLDLLASLSGPARAGMGLIHLSGGKLPSPIQPTSNEREFLQRVDITAAQAGSALEMLNGSLIRLKVVASRRWWEYHHPTFADAYQAWLEGHPELLREHVLTASLPTLLRRVTCGDVGIEGTLALPEPLFPVLLDRLLDAKPKNGSLWDWQRMTWTFLGRRCDETFIEAYVRRDPDVIIDPFDVGVWVAAHSANRLIATKLMQLGFAAEEQRLDLVERLYQYATSGEDGSFLAEDEWLDFFEPEELASLDEAIHSKTLPRLAQHLKRAVAADDTDLDEILLSIGGYAIRYPDDPGVHSALVLANAMESPEERDGHAQDQDRQWKVERQQKRLLGVIRARPSIFEDLV